MLVLSRHRDETVMIGDDIELTVVDIRGDKVRLGIKAPTRVPVHRKEIYEAIRRENEASLELESTPLATLRPGTPPPAIAGRPTGSHQLFAGPAVGAGMASGSRND